jgi:hypothetical protein
VRTIAKLGIATTVVVAGALVFFACVGTGPGSDFDEDGLKDDIEDRNHNFEFDPGETDFLRPDTDGDGLCDGRPDHELADCTGCEDCNNNGFWEPCLGETDPLNDDTDNDGIPDKDDPAPLDHLFNGTVLTLPDGQTFDCAGGANVKLAYGASLPSGKPFPVRPTATPSPAPFPTSTPGPSPTLAPIPFETETPGPTPTP